MKKLIYIFTLLFLLIGCNQVEGEVTEEEINKYEIEDPFRSFYTVDIDDFRPNRVSHPDVRMLLENIHEGIYRIDEEGNRKSSLTKKIQVEEKDGYIIYTIELKDAYFHNGKKLTPEDIRHSIFRMAGISGDKDIDRYYLENSKYWKNLINGDEGAGFKKGRIETINDEKIILYLDDHYGMDITSNLLAELYIIPKDYPELSQKSHPIGLGPYKFVEQNGNTIKLTRFEDYHDRLPEIKNIELKKISSKEERNKAFENGDLHILDSFPGRDKDEDYMPYANSIYSLVFNLEGEIMEDRELRSVIASKINKKQIHLQLFGESGAVVDSPLSPFSNPYMEGINYYKSYNPDYYYSVMEEKEEYGELELEIYYLEEDFLARAIGEFIVDDLKEEFLNLNLTPLKQKEYEEKVLLNKDYELAIVRYENNSDPFRTLDRFTTRALKNISNFYEFDYNDLMKDPTISYQNQLDMIYEEIPEVFIVDPGYSYILNENYKNIRTYPYPFMDYSQIKYSN